MDPNTNGVSTKDWINSLKSLTISGYIQPYEYNTIVYSPSDLLLDFTPFDESWIWEKPEIMVTFSQAKKDFLLGRVTRVSDLDSYLSSL